MQKAKIVTAIKPTTVRIYPSAESLKEETVTVTVPDTLTCRHVRLDVKGMTPAQVLVGDMSTAVYVKGKYIYISHATGEIKEKVWP